MLFSETSAAAFLLARFRGPARVLEKRARVPSSARVPEVAHRCYKQTKKITERLPTMRRTVFIHFAAET